MYKFNGLFGIVILRLFPSCVMLYQDTFSFKNLFLRRYACMLCNISLNTPIAYSVVCFPGMTSSLAKVNKSSGVHFLALSKISQFFDVLNI